MHLHRWLRLARQLVRPGDAPQRIAIMVIACGERFLGPILVHVATVSGAGWALATGALLSSVFALRGLLQSAHLAHTEAGVYERVVGSVLRQDVLNASVLPDEEARAVLFEGGHTVANLLAEGIPNLGANMLAAVVFAVYVALTEPPRIVAVAVLAGSAGIALLVMSRRVIERARNVESAAWVDLVDGVCDAFDGRLEIVAGGRADSYTRIFAEITSAWRSATLGASRVTRLAGRLPLLALAMSVGAAVVLDGVLRGEPAARTLGQAALLASMSPAFVAIAQGLQEIARSDRRVQQVLALVTVEPSPLHRGTHAPGDVRSVELRNVRFEYEQGGRRHEALSGVSFNWHAGELLAISGPNGSGKSTCLRVLLGLCRRVAGDIVVDGAPFESIDVERWRRGVAFLPQRPYLPPRSTVRECLRFVDRDITDALMTEAIERVGLSAMLLRNSVSPLEVAVDELSVGQRQRVGLARVLCRRAQMIVLDEPDANLDQAGIQVVARWVRELAQERMVLVAAHSPELLAVADRVITLESGRIARASTHQSASA